MAMDYTQLVIADEEPEPDADITPAFVETVKKTGRKGKLTPAVQRLICHYIRSGSFEHVAAGAAGVHRATFYRWMAEGEQAKTGTKRDFRDAVEEAKTAVRREVENEVRRQNPLAWLTKGPGRDRPGNVGWTDKQSVEHTGAEGGPIQTEARVIITIPHNGRDDLPVQEESESQP